MVKRLWIDDCSALGVIRIGLSSRAVRRSPALPVHRLPDAYRYAHQLALAPRSVAAGFPCDAPDAGRARERAGLGASWLSVCRRARKPSREGSPGRSALTPRAREGPMTRQEGPPRTLLHVAAPARPFALPNPKHADFPVSRRVGLIHRPFIRPGVSGCSLPFIDTKNRQPATLR